MCMTPELGIRRGTFSTGVIWKKFMAGQEDKYSVDGVEILRRAWCHRYEGVRNGEINDCVGGRRI
jgi:hypothetical protein